MTLACQDGDHEECKGYTLYGGPDVWGEADCDCTCDHVNAHIPPRRDA